MITIICGKPGAGKTSLNAKFLLDGLLSSRKRCGPSCDQIDFLNSSRFKFRYPSDGILSFSNFSFINKSSVRYGIVSKRLDPFRMALPNEDIPFDLFPPYSFFHIMEGQVYWNSRRRGLRDCVSRFFENHRHNHFEIFIDVQRAGLIDANIREIASRFIEVQKITNKTNLLGLVLRSKWDCLEFDSWQEYEHYLNSGSLSSLGKMTTYSHEGNIFSCYSSYENFPAFYKNCENCSLYDSYFSLEDETFLTMPKNYYEGG